MKYCLVFDMSNVFMRAYHATKRHGMSHAGVNTGSIKACISSVMATIRQRKPTHVALVWDNGNGSFRDDLVSDYKGQRQAPDKSSSDYDPAILEQKRAVRQALKAKGLLNIIAPPGYEADDVIGAIVLHFPGRSTIASNDKDFSQLVNEQITLLNSDLGLMGVQEVTDRWGVPPAKFLELLMLAGDKIDNVKGAHGIGFKTAAALLNRYGSIKSILKFVDDLPLGAYKGMVEFETRKDISRQLIALKTDVKVSTSKMLIGPEDPVALAKVAKTWNMTLT